MFYLQRDKFKVLIFSTDFARGLYACHWLRLVIFDDVITWKQLHIMELCERNSKVTGVLFRSKKPVMWSFGMFFVVGIKGLLKKNATRLWFQTQNICYQSVSNIR